MAKSSTDTPHVTTFSDHEVIVPPHKLSKAVTVAGRDTSPDFDPLARAEAALAQLSAEFTGWMHAECDRLDAARRNLKEYGYTDSLRADLFRAAHDIKGQAATFGFPLAAEAGDSLCRLIEHAPDFVRVPMALIDQHVDGVRAIIREDARATDNPIAVALIATLRQITEDFLVEENRDRPGYLEGVIAPSLAPGK